MNTIKGAAALVFFANQKSSTLRSCGPYFHVAQICCGQRAVREGGLGLAAELGGVLARLDLGKLAVLVRIGVGVSLHQTVEFLLPLGRLRMRRRRDPGGKNNRRDERQRQPVRNTNKRSPFRRLGYACAGSKLRNYIACRCDLCLHFVLGS
jgi:hypothetical protein